MTFALPDRDPCPFCENIAGRRPCAIIENSEETLAFVNPRQITQGATLVIPKRHAPTVFELTETEAAAIMRHVVRIAKALRLAFQPDGLNIFQNNGVASGQSVPHFHVHLVPRYEGDAGAGVFRSEGVPITPFEDRLRTAEEIKKHLADVDWESRRSHH